MNDAVETIVSTLRSASGWVSSEELYDKVHPGHWTDATVALNVLMRAGVIRKRWSETDTEYQWVK